MAEIGLTGPTIPTRVQWFMETPGVSASARIDCDGDQVEFGLYESVDGESRVRSGVARLKPESGEVTFRDEEDETLFEQFTEAVRLMKLEKPE
ncbi:hypothetical protein [Paraburkholderia hospita]|uniref:hypothetical protein n=1 Tax=Paraburkholderia hospita TaxID=169430 RepID=UPI00115FBC58|nr:hypothetical protein [Paraburkholderia hospita]